MEYDVTVRVGYGNASAAILDDGRHLSVASADWSDVYNAWWVSRVKVAKGYERQGRGYALVRALQRALKAREGSAAMVVAPGGYGTPVEALEAFYGALGFEKDPEAEGLLMVWRSE